MSVSRVLTRIELGRTEEHQAAWFKIKAHPTILKFTKLRKARTRMMVECMLSPARLAIKGNITVKYIQTFSTFHFLYRDTLIAGWAAHTNVFTEVNAGEYEETTSTRYQRKMLREAIEEFNREVIGTCG